MNSVELRGLSKRYPGGRGGLVDVSFTVAEHEYVVVLGPSGSGKTTLLRLIAGLEAPTAGQVWVQGHDVRTVPPHRRNVAMAFQHPALYPHLSVRQNLAYGLQRRRMAPDQMRTRVEQAAEALHIRSLLDRSTLTLSGGERQRAALAKVLVQSAGVTLLDEPLASIDTPLRYELRQALAAWHAQSGGATIHVTHDHDEARALGDRIVLLHEGRLEQVGRFVELQAAPASPFVAKFLMPKP